MPLDASVGDPSDYDKALVVRLARDDQAALSELMLAYGPRLVSIAELIVGSLDLAHEAVQEAFVRLWNDRHTLSDSRSVLGYLIRTTRHRAINIYHRERVHSRLAQMLTRRYTITGATEVGNTGAEALEHEEFRGLLQNALATMPPRCRQIFLLRREAGMSYEEMEATLGVSNATLRNQMARATKHLAEAVKRWRSDLEH